MYRKYLNSTVKSKTQKATILIVDDVPTNLNILKDILQPIYSVKVASCGETALQIVQTTKLDLILLDVMMPNMDGFEVCRRLKAQPDLAAIPVVFISAVNELEDEQVGFEVGAVDYIFKPLIPCIVIARVRNYLLLADQQKAAEELACQRTEELKLSQLSAISMLSEAGHYNDTDSGLHIWRMAKYAEALAQAAHWPVARSRMLGEAAPMHDTGKIGIDDHILKAPRKLAPEEWDIMKTHAELGYNILSKSESPLFKLAAEIALHHHEKWDGSGYPQGLKGKEIPESARIVAIADVFDALTMQRPYKQPWNTVAALSYIQENAGIHFDPDLVKLFVAIKDDILRIKAQFNELAQVQD